jgi:pimeloyl-ACP methyl ester carboxylesterase
MPLLRQAIVLSGLLLALTRAQEQPTPPPIGRLVDVGGHRVHLYCTGEGSPTVMVVGAYSFDWDLVQTQVAKFTRICTYDVAGTAWSDPGATATCPDRASEIRALLQNAGISSPFVFAGLYIGGLISRYYAQQYPDEVSGMVIVDHAFTPRPISRPEPKANANGDSPPVLIEMTPIVVSAEDLSKFNNLPEPMRKLHRWAASRGPGIDHTAAADDCESRLSSSPGSYPLGDRPLVVISTGNQTPGYAELQARLLALSHNSSQAKAKSFHSVEIDQPGIVTGAIQQVVEAVRLRAK